MRETLDSDVRIRRRDQRGDSPGRRLQPWNGWPNATGRPRPRRRRKLGAGQDRAGAPAGCKIIDLSDDWDAQPMHGRRTRPRSVVFNGCIYNYRELRSELEAAGYRFFSTSDTEVLLKAYHRWGPEFVQELKGMFAFAIVETRSGRTMLGARPPRHQAPLPGRRRCGDVALRLHPPGTDRGRWRSTLRSTATRCITT